MTGAGRSLLEDATANPTDIDTERIIATVRDVHPEEYEDLLEAVRHVLDATESIAEPLVTALIADLDNVDDDSRLAAVRILVNIAAAHPDTIVEHLPALADRLEDQDPAFRGGIAQVFLAVSREAPDPVMAEIDALEPLLADEVPYVAEVVIRLARSSLPNEAPALAPLIDDLVSFLASMPEIDSEDRRRWVRYHPSYREVQEQQQFSVPDGERIAAMAADVLATFAEERPEDVRGHDQTLVEVLERERSTYLRLHLLDTIGAIAAIDPDVADQAIEPVATVLADAPTDSLAAKAAWTLAWLGEGRAAELTTAIEGELDTLIDGLEAEDDELVEASAAVLSYVAEHDPAAVRRALPRVRELLESEEPQIRGLAVWILGYAGTEDDLMRLNTVRDADGSDEVSAAAGEAASLLAARHS